MKIKSAIAIALLLAAVLIVAGCTTQGGTTTTTHVTTTTQVTTAGQPCSRATISGDVLVTYLPAARSGWTAGTPFWMTGDTGEGCDYSWAFNTYEMGALSVTVMIYDTNSWEGLPLFGSWGYSWSSSAGYGKSVTVNGYPGYETATTGQDITVMVNVGNGIIAWAMLDGSADVNTVYSYANAINYAGLDGLA